MAGGLGFRKRTPSSKLTQKLLQVKHRKKISLKNDKIYSSCQSDQTHFIGETARLDDSFFFQSCTVLANGLLGKVLVRRLPSGEILKGKIVETESYLGIEDKASHTFNGKRTERNEAMFLKPGTAYVYSIYGMYYCFNISSMEEGSAVLIRAVEPIQGHSLMRQFRSIKRNSAVAKDKDLCNGPSKLCQAFHIEKKLLNKTDLSSSPDLWLESDPADSAYDIVACKRIGIDSYAEEWANKPLRFYVRESKFVSVRNKAAEKLTQDNNLYTS